MTWRLSQSKSGWPQSVRRAPRGSTLRAFLLVEYLLYIGILALVMGLAYGAFYRCLENARDLSRTTETILATVQAGELWRSDIRRAAGPPVRVAEEGLVVLEIPTKHGRVAYLFGERALWRKEDDAAPKKLLSRVRASEMHPDQTDQLASWRWEIELETRQKGARVRPMFTFQAVPLFSKP